MTTDQEQDLLRAMLVFAAAGLDSLLKQLIRDALAPLAHADPKVEDELEQFVARRIRTETSAPEVVVGSRFVARVLIAKSPRERVVEEYIQELTGASLQSAAELMRTAGALGLDPKALGIEPQRLKPIFEIRNAIIHELDVDLSAKRRKRRIRGRDSMVEYTGALLGIGQRILQAVDAKLATRERS